MTEIQAPQAKRIPHTMTAHGETRTDEFFWLRDRENPDTIAYLEAENAYLEAHGPSVALRATIHGEQFARVKQIDPPVPVLLENRRGKTAGQRWRWRSRPNRGLNTRRQSSGRDRYFWAASKF
jgi:protease II